MMKLFTEPNVSISAPRGFTLVETLVAITIIMVAMIAPFYAIQQSLSASYAARDELIASMLAQEGVEYVLDVRDDNHLAVHDLHQSPTWLYGLDGTNNSPNCFAPNVCVVDPSQLDAQLCPTSSCSTLPLYLSASNIYNQQESGTQTRFVRTVQLTSLTSHEVEVNVTVKWVTDHLPYTTTVTEYIDDWQ